MAKWATVASINQTGAGIRLPNFCNLGVMLRSLIVANLFVLAAAVAHAPGFAALPTEIGTMAAFAEPAILASLVVLCALRPVLHRMRYAASIALVALVAVITAVNGIAEELFFRGFTLTASGASDGTDPVEAARLIGEAVSHVRTRQAPALLRLTVPRQGGWRAWGRHCGSTWRA